MCHLDRSTRRMLRSKFQPSPGRHSWSTGTPLSARTLADTNVGAADNTSPTDHGRQGLPGYRFTAPSMKATTSFLSFSSELFSRYTMWPTGYSSLVMFSTTFGSSAMWLSVYCVA